MNKTKKIIPIVAVIAAAAIFVLPSLLSSPALATQTLSNSDAYKKLQACLSTAASNGDVTRSEVENCFSSVYETGNNNNNNNNGNNNNSNN
jgi:type II secretory pathway pseudopilin PulG